MEKTKLSTKLEYPQISEIFKNWKIMSTWGKERLIYENESKKIQCFIRLNLIDTINKFLNFEILCFKEKYQQYIFNPKFNMPFKERKKRFDYLLENNSLFSSAIQKNEGGDFDSLRKIAFWCVKHKAYHVLDCIGRIKYALLKIGYFKY